MSDTHAGHGSVRVPSDGAEWSDHLYRAARLATVGELLSGIAHEINQPLAAITTFAGALRRSVGPDPKAVEQARAIAEAIAAQALRAAEVVRRVRSLVKHTEFHLQFTDVNDTVREVMTLAEPLAEAHGVALRLALAATLPRVRADAIHVQLLLLNLIQNAIEAIEAHRSVDRRIVICTVSRETHEVEVSVEDTGGGMTTEVEAQLFRPFNTTKPQGVGLGLLSCQRIAEAHQGRLRAENFPGVGARFSLTLPPWNDVGASA
jgi:C4-dicarboxylate-specific signal transduction histidine kinase